jgi:hypothetical protein
VYLWSEFGRSMWGVCDVKECVGERERERQRKREIETCGVGIRKLWSAGNGAGVATFGKELGAGCGIGVCECTTIGKFYI